MIKHNNLSIKWMYNSEYNDRIKNTSIQTICILTIKNGDSDTPRIGVANCRNFKEFNKDVGRKLSLSRVLKSEKISKEDKEAIWESYRTMTKIPRWTKKYKFRDKK